MTFERERPATSPTRRARSLRRRMTWSEQLLWDELRKLGANFRRQAPIGPYFADFASHGFKIVIEVDGGVHERLDDVAVRDGERELWLKARGYRVIRFTGRQVEDDAEACGAEVRALLPGARALSPRDAEEQVWREWSPASPTHEVVEAVRSPPTPALPPSRRKGA
jgi:very-short-patch-repair endonuclease